MTLQLALSKYWLQLLGSAAVMLGMKRRDDCRHQIWTQCRRYPEPHYSSQLIA